MINLPAGAIHDSRAPYNDTGDLCRHCDRDTIAEGVPEDTEDRDVVVEELINDAGLCDPCGEEYVADWLEE